MKTRPRVKKERIVNYINVNDKAKKEVEERQCWLVRSVHSVIRLNYFLNWMTPFHSIRRSISIRPWFNPVFQLWLVPAFVCGNLFTIFFILRCALIVFVSRFPSTCAQDKKSDAPVKLVIIFVLIYWKVFLLMAMVINASRRRRVSCKCCFSRHLVNRFELYDRKKTTTADDTDCKRVDK